MLEEIAFSVVLAVLLEAIRAAIAVIMIATQATFRASARTSLRALDAGIALPAWLVLHGRTPRRFFRRFRIVAGPTKCVITRRVIEKTKRGVLLECARS
jgi:hypothetical protein